MGILAPWRWTELIQPALVAILMMFYVRVTSRLWVMVWGPCCWQGFGDRERLRALIMCQAWDPCINIHAVGSPPETVWPPCGLNPIYRMLSPTKHQSLSSPLWENKWPRHKAPGTRNTSATLSFSCHHLLSLSLQYMTSLKLVSTSPFTGAMWSSVNEVWLWRAGESPFPRSKWSLANH